MAARAYVKLVQAGLSDDDGNGHLQTDCQLCARMLVIELAGVRHRTYTHLLMDTWTQQLYFVRAGSSYQQCLREHQPLRTAMFLPA